MIRASKKKSTLLCALFFSIGISYLFNSSQVDLSNLPCKKYVTKIINGSEIQEQMFLFSNEGLKVTSTYNEELQNLNFPPEVTYLFEIKQLAKNNGEILADVKYEERELALKIAKAGDGYNINWISDTKNHNVYRCLD